MQRPAHRNAFERLGFSPRPAIDLDLLKSRFFALAERAHPDAGGETDAFAELNAAHRTLANPASRLRHLMQITFPDAAVAAPDPSADAEIFLAIAAALQRADSVIRQAESASTALGRAVLSREIAAAAEQLESVRRKIDSTGAAAGAELARLDAAWPRVEAGELAALAARFERLDKWRAQVAGRLAALGAAR